MSSIPDQFPLSLRAWPQKNTKSDALASLISRINVERGGFRNITEESLDEEIRKADAGDDQDSSDESEEEQDEDETDRFKELMIAKEQMLDQLTQAHYSSGIALDFISLLLSKDTPVQASLTISPDLRSAVGLGTIGADKVADSKVTQAQRTDSNNIIRGWKLQSLNENADSVLASATKLEKEIEAETRYWQQLVEVDAKGWAVCTLPQEQHTLGVRIGFSESAPAFSNRSVAALRRQPDGSIKLDQGIAETPPQRLRVRIETNGRTTGHMIPPTSVPSDSPILPLILRARNSIFTDELWQELNREGRILLKYGVVCTGIQITYPLSPSKKIVLDLLPGDDNSDVEQGVESQEDNDLAHGLYLSLYLLLSNAHREKYNRRSQPPQPIDKRHASNQPLNLLRPVLARITHQSVVETLKEFFSTLSQTLVKAGLATNILSVSISAQPPSVSKSTRPSKAEDAIAAVFTNLDATFKLPVTASQSITVQTRTLIHPMLEPRFLISASDQLTDTAPPPQGLSGSAGLEEVQQYVLWATACAIAATASESGLWSSTYDASVIKSSGGKEVSFNVEPSADDIVLTMRTITPASLTSEASNPALNGDAKAKDPEVKAYTWYSMEGRGETQQLNEIMTRVSAAAEAGSSAPEDWDVGADELESR